MNTLSLEQFFEYVVAQMAPDGTNMSIDDEKLCYKAMEEYANQQNASLKLELQKQKNLCKATIALLDNIMSDMKEEDGNQWYTDQIEELIKQSEPLIYKPNEI